MNLASKRSSFASSVTNLSPSPSLIGPGNRPLGAAAGGGNQAGGLNNVTHNTLSDSRSLMRCSQNMSLLARAMEHKARLEAKQGTVASRRVSLSRKPVENLADDPRRMLIQTFLVPSRKVCFFLSIVVHF